MLPLRRARRAASVARMHASTRRPRDDGRAEPGRPARPRPESADVDAVRTAQQTLGNAAVTRLVQRKLADQDAERLREYYAFLVETRDIAPGAYDKVVERIIERY